MMKLKRTLIFLLCMALTLPLFACGDDSASGAGGGGGNGQTYTITFDVGDDARNAGVDDPESRTVKDNETVPNLPVPKDYGNMVFRYWKNGSTQFTSQVKVHSDLTLVAYYTDSHAQDAEKEAYEKNIDSWSKPGHLYIHYKRYDHNSGDIMAARDGDAPTYNNRISSSSNTYYNWALWAWPSGDEGRTFNVWKVDESGAVFDVLVDHTYTDAGWDGLNKKPADPPLTINYTSAQEIGIQLFDVSSRTSSGYWKNDGDNNYLTFKEIARENGSYHWFVSQGKVPYGGPTYTSTDMGDDPYKNIPKGSATTDRDLSVKGVINSNVSNKSTYNINQYPVKDYETTGVGYQVFIASFRDGLKDKTGGAPEGKGMGDLRGVIDAIDEGYFTDLNVDVLWLTPFQTSTNYHGYDIMDYFSVDPRFGTLSDYRELVYKAHSKGIKVVMDFVLNHTAKNNPWFIKSQNLVEENGIEYRNFYSYINEKQYNEITNKTIKDQWFPDAYGYYYYSSFGESMPELNYDYQPVRDAILDVCNYWMAFGLDGFRCDAVKHIYMKNETMFTKGGSGKIVDASNVKYAYDQTRCLNFWREFNCKLKKNYPNAFIVGENLDGNPENVGPLYEGMDSQFNFHGYYETGHALAAAGGGALDSKGNKPNDYANWSTGALANYKKELQGEQYNDDSGAFHDVKGYTTYNQHYIDGRYTSNHDLPRARDLMNIQTHGNDEIWRSFFTNAANDKSPTPTMSAIVTDRVNMTDKLLRLYYAFNMTLPGVSWIYNGDELGMTGNMNTRLTGEDETSHEDRIYRQPMKWHDTIADNSSFAIGWSTARCELVGLNATNYVRGYDYQKKDGKSIYSWMKTLTKVRNDHPELINGKVNWSSAKMDNGLMDFVVESKSGKTRVMINTGTTNPSVSASGTNLYASYNLNNGKLGQYGVAIFKA